MDNIITITTVDGKQTKVEVIDIFSVVGCEDKDYILYTQNIEVDKDNIKAYVSILEENNGVYSLKEIEDEKEFEDVQAALKEMDE